MPKPQKPFKQFNINVTVGKDADTGKVISQIHTQLAKSKHNDRVVINLNGALLSTAPVDLPDEGLALL